MTTATPDTLLLATRNAHKVGELRAILAEAGLDGFELVGADAYPEIPDVRETGVTFAENALLKAHALALGIPTDVHPHVLRHSFATHVLQSSGDLRAVQELLGHASITATQVYTALDFQHLAHVYDQAHPRAKKRD